MSLSVEAVLAVVGGAVSVTTAIFWGSYVLGKYTNRIEVIERRVDAHDEILSGLRAIR